MQLSLFDENNLLRGRFQQNLESLNLAGALETLRRLKAVGHCARDVAEKIAVVQALTAEPALAARSDPTALGSLYQRLAQREKVQGLGHDLRWVRTGLVRALAGLLHDGDGGYVCPGLHAAEVFSRAGRTVTIARFGRLKLLSARTVSRRSCAR